MFAPSIRSFRFATRFDWYSVCRVIECPPTLAKRRLAFLFLRGRYRATTCRGGVAGRAAGGL
eukprot:11928987-Alexandrium_andersonii.AAC.1